jgi:tetratricopeptide (TPR) repeat protein
MITVPAASLYNQDRLDDEVFLANFVAREELASFLVEQLRRIPANAAGEHHLIVGQRGMGKTSLLRRIAIGVNRDANLAARYIPLRFREEQYNVLSLEDLWRNCCEALAEWCEVNNLPDIADRLDRVSREDRSKNAEDCFVAETRKIGKRPLLLIDNLDLILEALSENDNWSLRRALQAKSGPILYGASTELLRQSGDRKAPFYEFFIPQILNPLSRRELIRCVDALADARGDYGKPVKNILLREPARLHTLHDLTGGNPRILTLIYRLLERSETDSVFADLEVLLDQVTPYYKSRIEEYNTKLQRAVIDAIALNWDPITTRDLSKVTGIEVTTISSQLSRLKNAGLIQEVSTSGTRAGYQLAERFLNIWYLMRHGTRRIKQKMNWLVKFLATFYLPDELRQLSAQHRYGVRSRRWASVYSDAVLAAEALERELTAGRKSIRGQQLETAYGNNQSAAKLHGAPSYYKWDSTLTKHTALNETAAEMLRESIRLYDANRYDEAITTLTMIAETLNTSEHQDLRTQVVVALLNQAFVLGGIGKRRSAITLYKKIIEQHSDSKDRSLHEKVVRAFLCCAYVLELDDEDEAAAHLYDEVYARFGDSQETSTRLLVFSGLTHKGLVALRNGRTDEAIKTCSIVVDHLTGLSDIHSRTLMIRAIDLRGLAFEEDGNADAAIAAFDDAIGRSAGSVELEIRKRALWVHIHRSRVLRNLGRTEEAREILDSIIDLGNGKDVDHFYCEVVEALYNRVLLQKEAKRGLEAVKDIELLDEKFGNRNDLYVRRTIVTSLMVKAALMSDMNRVDDEIAIYDEISMRFGEDDDLYILREVAEALDFKGMTLDDIGRCEDAIEVYEAVVSKFGEFHDSGIRTLVASALNGKGVALYGLKRYQEELETYDYVIARFKDDEHIGLQEEVLSSLEYKLMTLEILDLHEEALGSCDEIIKLCSLINESGKQKNISAALLSKGVALGNLGRNSEELELYDTLIAKYENEQDAEIHETVTRAVLNKAISLDRGLRYTDANSAYDVIVSRCSGRISEFYSELLGYALIEKGINLRLLGHHANALEIFEQVISLFSANPEPFAKAVVAEAYIERGLT